MRPPHKVLCKACHKVGKSWLAAALICWHFDCFVPGLTVTTAPTDVAVRDQLWREVRILRSQAGLGGWTKFRGPTAPELFGNHDHWAKGFTTAKGEAMHGRHQRHMLFVIDEGVGVEGWVYDVLRSQFKPGGEHHWLVIGNPTDTASQMYAEELSADEQGDPSWSLVEMAAPSHPNLAAELRGEPPPFPAAVSLAQFREWLDAWADPIAAGEATALDLEWPPGSGRWYRPGPEMEARALGRWPSAGTFGVWGDGLWQSALRELPLPHTDVFPEIGADIARFGDDYTEMHVRCGPCSLHHERHNGWPTDRTAGRLKELAREWAAWHNRRLDPAAALLDPQCVRVKIDDGGVGGGVTDQADGFNFVPVTAQHPPCEPDRYDSTRSELWFAVAERARRGRLSLARLPRPVLARLRQQAMAPLWKLDGQGRRKVEPKADTKKRLSVGSPDGLDALNLAFYEGGGWAAPEVLR